MTEESRELAEAINAYGRAKEMCSSQAWSDFLSYIDGKVSECLLTMTSGKPLPEPELRSEVGKLQAFRVITGYADHLKTVATYAQETLRAIDRDEPV